MVALDNARTLDDVKSREWLQTKTSSGHYWDQVVGVSQRCLNQNFATMFKLYPTMAVIYNDEPTQGMIDAKLHAPTMLIPGGGSDVGRSDLFFQLRFESGYMADSAGNVLIEDLTDWVITTKVAIDKQKAVITAGMSEEAKAKVLRENAWVDRFDKPGAYSAERVYAKLSSIQWQSFDRENTWCGLDEKDNRISFDNWAAAHPKAFLKLTTWLVNWSYEQDLAGRNIIGVSFNLPQNEDIRIPTYRPIFSMNQTYPYISVPQQVPDGATGFDGPGGCNAYLWTELVKLDPTQSDEEALKRKPDERALVWSGNFCTLPKVAGKPDSAIDGTFVLGRNVFLEKFLLPEFKALSKAFDICHQTPYGTQGSDGRIFGSAPYQIGRDPKFPDISSYVFDFNNQNPDSDPTKETVYRYRKVNKEGPVTVFNTNPRGNDFQAWTYDENQIDVTWVAGTNSVKIVGKAISKDDAIWNRGFEPPKSWDKLWAWVHDTYTVNFEFYLDVTTVPGPNNNGVLSIILRGFDKKTISVVPDEQHEHLENGNFAIAFREQLQYNFEQVIPTLVKNLQEKLKGRNFVFPGNGVFDFSNPIFGKYGHLLAQVKYKPLALDEKLFVSRPPKYERPIVVDPPMEVPVFHSDEAKFQLEWVYPKDPIPSALQKGKITIRAINKQKDLACQFKQIIFMVPVVKGSILFSDAVWADSSKPAPPAVVPPTPTTAGGTSTTTPVVNPPAAAATGMITLRQQITGKDQLVIKSITKIANRIRIIVDGLGSDDLVKLAPNDFFEIEFEGNLGPAGAPEVEVTEDWNEKEHAYFKDKFVIKLAAPSTTV